MTAGYRNIFSTKGEVGRAKQETNGSHERRRLLVRNSLHVELFDPSNKRDLVLGVLVDVALGGRVLLLPGLDRLVRRAVGARPGGAARIALTDVIAAAGPTMGRYGSLSG